MRAKYVLPGVLLGGLLFLFGCSDSVKPQPNYSSYNFKGKLCDKKKPHNCEDVEFISSSPEYDLLGYSRNNFLYVTKSDKTVIFKDYNGNDLKIDGITVIKKDASGNVSEKREYTMDDEIGKKIVEESQKKFDRYLKTIKETKEEEKLRQGKEDLK